MQQELVNSVTLSSSFQTQTHKNPNVLLFPSFSKFPIPQLPILLQSPSPMDIQTATDLKRRLEIELDEINARVHLRTYQIGYVLELLKIEIRRLDDDIDLAIRQQPQIKVAVYGGLNKILTEFRLICSASVTIFSNKIRAELYGGVNVMSYYYEPFPCTVQLVEAVLDQLEEYLMEKRDGEIEYYGFSDSKKCKKVNCSCTY